MNFAALVASRICHDLISPVGAISNGLELMSLTGDTGMGPELDLINDSVGNANARIRFFRIAFGHATPEQPVGRGQITSILQDIARASRITYDWMPQSDLPRDEVRMAFLALLCMENALPYGGHVEVDHGPMGWRVVGENDRINIEGSLWNGLCHPTQATPPTAAQVQFALLPMVAEDQDKKLCVHMSDTKIEIALQQK